MVEFTVKEEKLVCSFLERLDTAYCLDCESKLFEKIRESKMPIIFDLQKTNYVSSSFLRICLQAAKEKGGKNFSLTNVCPSVKKVFKIAGFDQVMTIN